MGLIDLIEAIIRHPIESIATAVFIYAIAVLYNIGLPRVAGSLFADVFHNAYNVGILSIQLLAFASTIGLFLFGLKTFTNISVSAR